MSDIDQLIAIARGEIGKPYSAHRDCSGFTAWCFRQIGITIPEGSVAQYSAGRGINFHDIKPGDLVFWDTFGPSPGHVALHEGGGNIIHALNPSRGIIRSRLDANMGGPFIGIRRILGENSEPEPSKPPKVKKSKKSRKPRKKHGRVA